MSPLWAIVRDMEKTLSRERQIAQAMAATADCAPIVWSHEVVDAMDIDRMKLLQELRDEGCALDATPWGFAVIRVKQASRRDVERIMEMVRQGIMVREGEIVTEAIAKERANNIAMGLDGEFDFLRRVVS